MLFFFLKYTFDVFNRAQKERLEGLGFFKVSVQMIAICERRVKEDEEYKQS